MDIIVFLMIILSSMTIIYLFLKSVQMDCKSTQDSQPDKIIYEFTTIDKECPICLENKTNIKLKCDHYFHEDCILTWFEHDLSCPMCRVIV